MAELHPAACFRGEDGRQGRSPAFLCVQSLCPVSCSRSVKGCPPALFCVQPDGRKTQPFFLFALSSLSFYIHFSFLSFSLLFLFSPVLFLFYSLFYIFFLPAFFSFLLSFMPFSSRFSSLPFSLLSRFSHHAAAVVRVCGGRGMTFMSAAIRMCDARRTPILAMLCHQLYLSV